MIITVTPNPALDLTWHVDRIVPGETHRADNGRARAGGKGLNVARVAHAHGRIPQRPRAEVRAVTTVGGAAGGEFAIELADSALPVVLVPVAGQTRRSLAIVDDAAGDTTVVNERGAALADDEWDALRGEVDAMLGEAQTEPTEAVLVIAGSLPPEAPDDIVPDFVERGRRAGARVIVDTSGPALLTAADAGAHVLKPNARELAEATGLADPLAGARELLRRGAALVLVSLGEEGIMAVSADEVVRARLPQALRGNPVGAGDAVVAATAVLLADGVTDLERIVRRATAWSAAAVLMPLAGEIHHSWPELEKTLIVERGDS